MQKKILIALVSGVLAIASPSAFAECKGKSQSACELDNSCSWVTAFKRKDGVKVSAHCRTAPKAGTKSTKKKSESTKSSTKTSKEKKDTKSSTKKKDTKSSTKKKDTKSSTKKKDTKSSSKKKDSSKKSSDKSKSKS